MALSIGAASTEKLDKWIKLCIVLSILILAFGWFCGKYPEHISTLGSMITDISETRFINIDTSGININLNNKFELPSIDFNIDTVDIPTITMPTISISIYLIIFVAISMILSCVSRFMCAISTVTLSIACYPILAGAVDAHSVLCRNGASTWQAGWQCIITVLICYLFVSINGALVESDGYVPRGSTFLSYIVDSLKEGGVLGVIMSLIPVILSYLLFGFGTFWAGWINGIYFFHCFLVSAMAIGNVTD